MIKTQKIGNIYKIAFWRILLIKKLNEFIQFSVLNKEIQPKLSIQNIQCRTTFFSFNFFLKYTTKRASHVKKHLLFRNCCFADFNIGKIKYIQFKYEGSVCKSFDKN
jgi:hypothetical protein